MISFHSFSGTVTNISEFATNQNNEKAGCYQLMTVEDEAGMVVQFVISPSTYFIDNTVVQVGDQITGYYDVLAPVPLIYPPQYIALVIVKQTQSQIVKVDYFNSQLISSDGMLKLNIAPNTEIVLRNGQPFLQNPANRNLVVSYGPSTKSIPTQAVPCRIVVWC